MSIHRYETGDGTRYRVRWRDLDGKLRSATVLSKGDANNLDTDIKARKLRAELLPTPSRETLDQAFDKWMKANEADLAAATYASYRVHWDAHIRTSHETSSFKAIQTVARCRPPRPCGVSDRAQDEVGAVELLGLPALGVADNNRRAQDRRRGLAHPLAHPNLR